MNYLVEEVTRYSASFHNNQSEMVAMVLSCDLVFFRLCDPYVESFVIG